MHIHPTLTERSSSAPKLGSSHGYSVDHDSVTLNADLALSAPQGSAGDAQWALQLWACEQPYAGGSLHGIKVAETTIDVSTAAAQAGHFNAQTAANLPTAARDFAMVMVLAAGRAGAFDQIQDFANYPAREHFSGPRLEGSVGYAVEGEEVVIRADSVFNARQEGNLSGSLVLELRAHGTQADGTDEGLLLAWAELGSLSGQYSVGAVERRVPFSAPHAGTWNLSLQLREWAGDAGYALRDWCEFGVPYRREVELRAVKPAPVETPKPTPSAKAATSTPAPEAKTPAAPSPVAVLRPLEAKATPTPEAKATPAAEAKATPAPEAKATPAAEAKATPAPEAKATPAAEAKATPAPTAKKNVEAPAPAPIEAASARVSLSRASVEELSAVKGLNRRLASDIVRARPFKSIDELVKVRGIGPRMLKGLREQLEL